MIVQKSRFIRSFFIFFLVPLTIFFVAIGFWKIGVFQSKKSNEIKINNVNCNKWIDSSDCKKWLHEFETIGPRQAYAQFKLSHKNDNPDANHLLMHYFGQLLYETVGVSGIDVCDNDFDYGCFHGFLGHAIPKEGLGIVTKLNQECLKNPNGRGGCQHGIGHGILVYLGYKESTLSQAISICKALNDKSKLGCSGGIYMEYNLRTMLDKNSPLRIFDPKNPTAPCDQLPSSDQSFCYYWLPQWWTRTLPGTIDEKFGKMGKMCDNLGDTESKKQCFLGIGQFSQDFANYNIERTISLCAEAGNLQEQVLCRAAAGRIFYAADAYRSQKNQLCKGLPESLYDACLNQIEEEINTT